MKTIEMTIPEFLNFRKEAIKEHIAFFCHILIGGHYAVEADEKFLTELGF